LTRPSESARVAAEKARVTTPLNDPCVVQEQYEREDNLRARQSIYDEREGPDGRQVVFETIAALRPRRVLEVGGGQGELAERLMSELRVDLEFVDQSERMIELARSRGLSARLGDVQALPFADGTFDCAVAAWMLYHVRDLNRGIAELARVLGPGGSLVAVTNSEHHLSELRELFGQDVVSSFTRESGEIALQPHFSRVERMDLNGAVTIRDRDQVIAYRDSMMTTDNSRELVFDVPLRVRTASSVFVATR